MNRKRTIEMIGVGGWLRSVILTKISIPIVNKFGKTNTCGCVTFLGYTMIASVDCLARTERLRALEKQGLTPK